jgi:thioredoxin 1
VKIRSSVDPISQSASQEGTQMSLARIVTDDTFEAEVLRCPRPVIVEYWAAWCGPCRQVAPVLDSIAADYVGVVDLVKINVDENP